MPHDPDVNDVAAALQLSIGLCIRQLRQLQDPGRPELARSLGPQAIGPKWSDLGDRVGQGRADQCAVDRDDARDARGARVSSERRPHPSDGRRSVLSITESGMRALTDKHNGRAEHLAKVLSTEFGPAELRQLMVVAPLIERLARICDRRS